jgi:ATP-dependent protease HslVU (ClpYQ) peptidase subunit
MTCIIGYSNGKEVHIAGDSGGYGNIDKCIRKDEKVFNLDNKFIIGYAGSFRLGQILRYDFTPPAKPDGITDMHYLVSYFIDSLRQVLKDKGYSIVSDNQEGMDAGVFLLGYNGNLYTVDSDFQVGCNIDNVDSIGIGAYFAIGAWDALDHMKITKQRLFKALDIASKRCIMVSKPYIYEVLK